MSERYSRLFALPENLYAVGSPVIIAAGTLLKDTQTGKIIAQLKLKSISPKAIKAVKVKLDLFDTAGNPLDDSVVYDYLDLNVSRDVEFGQKNPVMVPNAKTRSYKASITEVVYDDRSVWTGSVGNWEPLSKPSRLVFQDYELQRQYEIKFGGGSVYETKSEKDLWHCTCGALNRNDELCHICHNSLSALETVDMAALEKEKDARLTEEARVAAEKEKKTAEELAARMAAAKEAQKKTKKFLKIAIPTICTLIAFVILLNTVFIPNIRYNNAMEQIKSGNIIEAYEILITLGNYKDCVVQADAIYEQYKLEKINAATIGDSVLWGSYEQDDNALNGKEEIEWIVLDKTDGKILVISNYILDCHPFNDTLAEVTWENCTLRKWLNNDFLNAAFTSAELKIIPTVQLSVNNDAEEDLLDGNVTQDKVFLLSATERDKYFQTKANTQPTEYAISNGAYYEANKSPITHWWTRTINTAYGRWGVCEGGAYGAGLNVNVKKGCVRPAMWIELTN